jgi:ATP-dependent Lon protease
VIRSIAVKVAEGDRGPFAVKELEDLRTSLGPPKFTSDIAERMDEPGIATGLAWTSVGGEILFIEATRMYGKGKLQLTGQLGEVMKESAQAAMSYVRTHAKQLHVPEDFLENGDVHIHIPTGGVPKDGPSAGVTMMTALVSLLTGIRVRHDTAMTGEITLRGKVLPVGGIKEKVLAAHRAGIKRVIMPERCIADLDEVPQEVRDELEFIAVTKMDDVLLAALEDPGKLDLKPTETEDPSASAKKKGRARDRATPSSAP